MAMLAGDNSNPNLRRKPTRSEALQLQNEIDRTSRPIALEREAADLGDDDGRPLGGVGAVSLSLPPTLARGPPGRRWGSSLKTIRRGPAIGSPALVKRSVSEQDHST